MTKALVKVAALAAVAGVSARPLSNAEMRRLAATFQTGFTVDDQSGGAASTVTRKLYVPTAADRAAYKMKLFIDFRDPRACSGANNDEVLDKADPVVGKYRMKLYNTKCSQNEGADDAPIGGQFSPSPGLTTAGTPSPSPSPPAPSPSASPSPSTVDANTTASASPSASAETNGTNSSRRILLDEGRQLQDSASPSASASTSGSAPAASPSPSGTVATSGGQSPYHSPMAHGDEGVAGTYWCTDSSDSKTCTNHVNFNGGVKLTKSGSTVTATYNDNEGSYAMLMGADGNPATITFGDGGYYGATGADASPNAALSTRPLENLEQNNVNKAEDGSAVILYWRSADMDVLVDGTTRHTASGAKEAQNEKKHALLTLNPSVRAYPLVQDQIGDALKNAIQIGITKGSSSLDQKIRIMGYSSNNPYATTAPVAQSVSNVINAEVSAYNVIDSMTKSVEDSQAWHILIMNFGVDPADTTMNASPENLGHVFNIRDDSVSSSMIHTAPTPEGDTRPQTAFNCAISQCNFPQKVCSTAESDPVAPSPSPPAPSPSPSTDATAASPSPSASPSASVDDTVYCGGNVTANCTVSPAPSSSPDNNSTNGSRRILMESDFGGRMLQAASPNASAPASASPSPTGSAGTPRSRDSATGTCTANSMQGLPSIAKNAARYVMLGAPMVGLNYRNRDPPATAFSATSDQAKAIAKIAKFDTCEADCCCSAKTGADSCVPTDAEMALATFHAASLPSQTVNGAIAEQYNHMMGDVRALMILDKALSMTEARALLTKLLDGDQAWRTKTYTAPAPSPSPEGDSSTSPETTTSTETDPTASQNVTALTEGATSKRAQCAAKISFKLSIPSSVTMSLCACLDLSALKEAYKNGTVCAIDAGLTDEITVSASNITSVTVADGDPKTTTTVGTGGAATTFDANYVVTFDVNGISEALADEIGTQMASSNGPTSAIALAAKGCIEKISENEAAATWNMTDVSFDPNGCTTKDKTVASSGSSGTTTSKKSSGSSDAYTLRAFSAVTVSVVAALASLFF